MGADTTDISAMQMNGNALDRLGVLLVGLLCVVPRLLGVGRGIGIIWCKHPSVLVIQPIFVASYCGVSGYNIGCCMVPTPSRGRIWLNIIGAWRLNLLGSAEWAISIHPR